VSRMPASNPPAWSPRENSAARVIAKKTYHHRKTIAET
jgi:hypothetical protein